MSAPPANLRAGARPPAAAASLLILALLALGCAPNGDPSLTEASSLSPVVLKPAERLRVAATSSIVSDVVSAVGGYEIELTLLIPIGVDPHSYQPAPQDLAAVARAHVVFANGFGLEDSLLETLSLAAEQTPVVSVSAGVSPRRLGDFGPGPEGGSGSRDNAIDPHVWLDPTNVMAWVRTIERALSALTPDNAAVYRANALAYLSQLEDLHTWIGEEVSRISSESRRLVTDHDSIGYFADRYGFKFVGAVTSGFSTAAEPSARELVALQERIAVLRVRAVFVETTIDPLVAARMAEDTGIVVLPLYSGSLSTPVGPAPTYLEMMRHNVRTIIEGLG
ncbi:MAG: metal ABC transporter substrate-binding protein [Anaerolineae bacterium]